MRLITGKGYVGGGPLFADSFINAYVELDDLLADDIYSFQSDLLHFLTERFQVKDYAHLVGTNFSAQFSKAHQAGEGRRGRSAARPFLTILAFFSSTRN